MKNIISRYTREYQLPAKVTRKHPAAKNAKLTAFNRRGAKDITGLLQIIKKSPRLCGRSNQSNTIVRFSHTSKL